VARPKTIPMDPIKFDWNEFAKRKQKLMKFYSKRELILTRISNTLFVFGFIVALLAILLVPKPYNIIIFVLYIILMILRKTTLRQKPFGGAMEQSTKESLPFAIIRIFSKALDTEISHKITDKRGRYYCLIPNGEYYVKIEKKNKDESYSEIYVSEPIKVTKGFINKIFIV